MGLDQVELIMEIEEHFGIDIPNEVAGVIYTVGDLTDWVQGAVRADQPGSSWTAAQVESDVKTIVAEELGANRESLHRGTRFIEDLHAG